MKLLEKEGKRTKDMRIVNACEKILKEFKDRNLKLFAVDILKNIDSKESIDVLKSHLTDKIVSNKVWSILEEKANEKIHFDCFYRF